MSKDMDFCSLQQISLTNMGSYWILLQNRTRCCKNCFQKVVHKTAEAGELIGNKIAEKIVKPKLVPDVNIRNVEQIVIPPEKRQEMLNELRHAL